ncbi:hypothetical protein [Streptomyces sp. KR55]|uniref:hypothetical protein n=1 Tax=Streptomyces sp. KR55 TaxID=3457425 RepID=UPI003FD074A9
MFVDNSGRRARLLRRIGLLLGVACLGYAVVLGAAFMGWGTSLNPSSLLPFADGANGQGGPAPQGGPGNGAVPPGGTPSAPPSGAAAPIPTPTSSASAVAAAN